MIINWTKLTNSNPIEDLLKGASKVSGEVYTWRVDFTHHHDGSDYTWSERFVGTKQRVIEQADQTADQATDGRITYILYQAEPDLVEYDSNELGPFLHPTTMLPMSRMLESKQIPCPQHLLPGGGTDPSFDPDVLRAAAEAFNKHPWANDMQVKAWVVLYLLEKAGL